MAVFQYAARTRDGEKIEATIEADDRRSALVKIERLGQIPVSVKEAQSAPAPKSKKPTFTWRTRQRMSMREVLVFTTELSDLLASGMPLGQALNALASRKSGKPSDKIIEQLRDEIIRGTSLSDALAMHPSTFTELYCSMIQAGEASGALHEVLMRLVEHYERMQEIKEKVIMALVYPAIVMFMGVVTLAFSMIYVVPKFKTVFEQMDQTLPLPTRMLLGISEGAVRYGWFVAGGIVLLCVLLNRAVKTKKGRFWWHGLQIRIPLIRGVVASATFANFARTLGTLLKNGVPVLQALGIVQKTVGNDVIGEEIRRARERVTDGTTISRPLAQGKVFPVIMTDMLAIGEQTGDMPGALSHISRRYENELDRNIKVFTTALEPILIVVVAVAVGFVAISILMAVFNLTSGLNV